MRIQQKVSNIGFKWIENKNVKEKVLEELEEFLEETNLNNSQKIQDEFGDLLFSLINYGRFIGIDPNSSLEKTNKKFIKRFMSLESKINLEKKNFQSYSKKELIRLWNLAKKND
jgi:XTP/dITP diphosphohydrolase